MKRVIKTLCSPPVLALLTGLLIMPYMNSGLEALLASLYMTAKPAMSALGMLILGIWMGNVKISWLDFKQSIVFTAYKFFYSVLISIFVAYSFYAQIDFITKNMPILSFIELLPPAANIIVLETYYLKSGRSAPNYSNGNNHQPYLYLPLHTHSSCLF
ncbi:hypothetical protein [Bartonella rattaustraliani]|uniref:hypothetical protein n=1 Tax=Bartonella rattaustraliani TaxID=481139 RepID=UPI0002E84669|nr:hypothetical protein [Bartonella rattaustraliani]